MNHEPDLAERLETQAKARRLTRARKSTNRPQPDVQERNEAFT